ncbi:Uncharacterized protein HZ326_19962 [Fusarium oxysporum f. sp. albedinis]|nr:Uncharacterized protein HZ326_19962 [Fusarium oxysporum f. sp. albedinis]
MSAGAQRSLHWVPRSIFQAQSLSRWGLINGMVKLRFRRPTLTSCNLSNFQPPVLQPHSNLPSRTALLSYLRLSGNDSQKPREGSSQGISGISSRVF